MEKLKGVHIGFCGIDGAGKTTQMGLLYRWFKDHGINTVRYEETRYFVSEVSFALGQRLGYSSGQEYLGEDYYSVAMGFEFLRKNMLNIKPYTQNGTTVISSRTVFDWLAGTLARGCSPEVYEVVNDIVLFAGEPTITIWLDTAVEVAYQRIEDRGYDRAAMAFLKKFKVALSEQLSHQYSFLQVSGDGDRKSVHRMVIREITNALKF